jgi:hypothetical protein
MQNKDKTAQWTQMPAVFQYTIKPTSILCTGNDLASFGRNYTLTSSSFENTPYFTLLGHLD